MALVSSPIAKGRIKNDKTLARIGEKHRKTAAQVCLRWLVQPNVAAIPRTSRKVERLSENIEVFDFELSDDEMRQVSAMSSAEEAPLPISVSRRNGIEPTLILPRQAQPVDAAKIIGVGGLGLAVNHKASGLRQRDRCAADRHQ